ncbi:MAG: amidohydrolase family protein [Clostridia bacterium]|nr:amidohydrolase family protein [Clostridia bacterium]
MKIYDMHIHSWARTKYMEKPDPEAILANMAQAGIYGGCIFSNPPKEEHPVLGSSFEARMEELRGWTEGYTHRLFPILWIHPDEENIPEKMEQAVAAGVMGFKIICNNFYVYEEKCMRLLRKSAELNKPVLFHSGILFDNQVASQYNRPLNWEYLLTVKNLKFSMGHCGWPWTDECLALYGEFKFAPALPKEEAPEMFLDLTAGPQEPYRKDLMEKIYGMSWGIDDHLMFGTDCSADHYNPKYAKKWLDLDGAAMDGLNVSAESRQKVYQDNLMRFLGIDEK